MYTVLTEESLTRLSSNNESTMDAKDSPYLHAHSRISNSTILYGNVLLLSDLCTCIKFLKMASRMKPYFSGDQFEAPRETSKS